jgi:regulator of replication initiation timing
MRPSTSNSNQSNFRLYDEVHQLRSRVENSDKLRKEVDQLQKVVKGLIEENVTLSADLKHLNGIVHDLHESNSALKTRINLLELRNNRLNVDEMPSTRLYNNTNLNVSKVNRSGKSVDSDPYYRTHQYGVQNAARRRNEYGAEVNRRLAHVTLLL